MPKRQMVYQWSTKRFGVDPTIVGKTVATIEKKEGMCPPGRLVDVAKSEGSPLHPLFTWDDGVAADRWRTHEARLVIGSLAITVLVGDEEVQMPAFVSVGHRENTVNAGTGYRSVSVVMADADFATEALDEALAKLNALRRRYSQLSQLASVWEAVDQLSRAEVAA